MKNIDKEEWKHYLTEYLCTGIEDCLQRKLPTSGHKLSLLAYALLEPIYQRCIFLKMPRDEETTIRRMSSKKKKFLAFLEEVDKIRFVYILPVGFKDLDEKTNELFYALSLISWPQRMKKWPDFTLELADLELEKQSIGYDKDYHPRKILLF